MKEPVDDLSSKEAPHYLENPFFASRPRADSCSPTNEHKTNRSKKVLVALLSALIILSLIL